MLNQTIILDYLKSHKKEFEEKYDITKIGLFGSYAKNSADENSDIDIIIHTQNKNYKNRQHLKYTLENAFNKKIDLGYFDTLRGFIKNDIKEDIIYV